MKNANKSFDFLKIFDGCNDVSDRLEAYEDFITQIRAEFWDFLEDRGCDMNTVNVALYQKGIGTDFDEKHIIFFDKNQNEDIIYFYVVDGLDFEDFSRSNEELAEKIKTICHKEVLALPF